MKTILSLLFFTLIIVSCSQQGDDTKQLQARIDSLQQKLNNTYRPGLGEFMLGIQEHHAKLWFAGINKNWALADFEVHEIGEAVDDIRQYCMDRPEIKSIGTIDPGITAINNAIKQKDADQFKKGFVELTSNCNTCHKNNQHGFNVIIIPNGFPVENQNFKPGN
jgi:hypothetical protein